MVLRSSDLLSVGVESAPAASSVHNSWIQPGSNDSPLRALIFSRAERSWDAFTPPLALLPLHQRARGDAVKWEKESQTCCVMTKFGWVLSRSQRGPAVAEIEALEAAPLVVSVCCYCLVKKCLWRKSVLSERRESR